MNDLYDRDILLWSEQQSERLRRHAAAARENDQIDWPHIIEEIEALGRSQRRELRSRVLVVLVHLLKLQLSASHRPRPGWRTTVLEQQAELEAVLDDSPSLRPTVPALIQELLPLARRQAITALEDYGDAFSGDPAALSFTQDQVLGPWLPPRNPPGATSTTATSCGGASSSRNGCAGTLRPRAKTTRLTGPTSSRRSKAWAASNCTP